MRLHRIILREHFLFRVTLYCAVQIDCDCSTLEDASIDFNKMKEKVREQLDGDTILIDAAKQAKAAIPRVYFIFDKASMSARDTSAAR